MKNEISVQEHNKSRQARTLRVLDGKPLRGFRPCAQRYVLDAPTL